MTSRFVRPVHKKEELSCGIFVERVFSELLDKRAQLHILRQSHNTWVQIIMHINFRCEFSPDGQMCAIGDEDGLKIWRMTDENSPVFSVTLSQSFNLNLKFYS